MTKKLTAIVVLMGALNVTAAYAMSPDDATRHGAKISCISAKL